MVRYKGAWAHYNISPETAGICEARLLKWEDEDQLSPPQHILLLRSMRHWVGSSDERALIDELGEVIENSFRNRDSLSPESR